MRGGVRAQYPHEPNRPVDGLSEIRTCLSTNPAVHLSGLISKRQKLVEDPVEILD